VCAIKEGKKQHTWLGIVNFSIRGGSRRVAI
jgi:hypothetical protein